MGGSINVAVRLRTGEAYCKTLWTNELPRWFKNPKMFEGDDDYVRSFLNMDRYKDDNYYGKKSGLHNSEYGLIVWDYVSNFILENNGYTSLDSIMAFEIRTKPEEFKLLANDGRLKSRTYDNVGNVAISDSAEIYENILKRSIKIDALTSWDDYIIDTRPMTIVDGILVIYFPLDYG